MKFKDRKEQRKVQETISALFISLSNYVNKDTRECMDKALQIIEDTEIEETSLDRLAKADTKMNPYIKQAYDDGWRDGYGFAKIEDINFSK